MHGSPTIILDACIIYRASLRDLLMELALNGLFKAKWTKDIDNEWMKSLLKNRPDLTHEKLEKTRLLMNIALPDYLVDGYEPIIETIDLPDKKDRHVLAAAIRVKADAILTYNIKDFPKKFLNPYNIDVQHPDDFLKHLIETAPPKFYASIRKVKGRLKNPPICTNEYLDNLENQSLPQTVSLLREYGSII
jgi:predicted nucleic acid-binding protein